MNKKALIPSGISSLRIAALPLFLYFNSTSAPSLCLLVFALAAGTDLLDGFIARKLKVASKTGAYFDVVTDFTLITGIFVAFTLNSYYSPWMLLLIAGSFAQFILTGHYAKQLYDPLGKYIGSVLYVGIAVTLLSPTAMVLIAVQVGVFAFTMTSFITRTISFTGIHKKVILINDNTNIKHAKTQTTN